MTGAGAAYGLGRVGLELKGHHETNLKRVVGERGVANAVHSNRHGRRHLNSLPLVIGTADVAKEAAEAIERHGG